MPTIQKSKTVVELLSCTKECENNCLLVNDRHYPFDGTIGRSPSNKLIRLNIFVGPSSPSHCWENLETTKTPMGYKLWTSFHHGSEDWDRYWWWNGRIPSLKAGDILQERYYVYPKLTPSRIARLMRSNGGAYLKELFLNYLVVEDKRNKLTLLKIKRIPENPQQLLEKLRT